MNTDLYPDLQAFCLMTVRYEDTCFFLNSFKDNIYVIQFLKIPVLDLLFWPSYSIMLEYLIADLLSVNNVSKAGMWYSVLCPPWQKIGRVEQIKCITF